MTVKHLQALQRQQLAAAVAADPTVYHKFKNGFSECATEVNQYIGNVDEVENGVKHRLAAHLNGCVNGLQQTQAMSFPLGQSSTIPLTISQGTTGVSIQTGSPGDVNNNQNARVQVPAGIQLIPSRLPTGELALLVPNSTNIPFFSNSMLGNSNYPSSTENIQRNPSAFTSVRPSKPSDTYKMKLSPPPSPASSTMSYEEQPQDSFSRPRTPSPKEISISFPTPPGPSAFKPNLKQDISPPQQFQVSSTSISPENKQLKIEYKSVPIYQYEKASRTKSMEPLSVVTIDRHKPSDNLELFKRKRMFPDGLLVISDEPSTSKQGRYSDENSAIISSSSRSPDGPQHKPSTSHQNIESHDSMWRPW